MGLDRGRRFGVCWLWLAVVFFSSSSVLAKVEYTYGTDATGVTRALAYDRTPALYTGDFGDCLGGQSLFNITKFDAAYYSDNLTIVFHLDGTTNIKNESLMMHISVDAYGSGRYEDTFDPCFLNLYSLCPLNASVPVTAWAKIPVGPVQIGGIPPVAFAIPDFEGTARVRIFANSSESEIGCFQAAMSNGNSFSQPVVVAPILGTFTLGAIIASFVTAAYGVSIIHMRMHYAHSLSVFVVFETFQSIFFTGALSVNWPSVCVAWWSNFAWSAGMMATPSMIHSVNAFAGVSGNASQVGGAGSVVLNTAGGLLTQIYGRSLLEKRVGNVVKRAAYNASNPFDYTWAGSPVTPGMPLPGTWSGFPATLAAVGIPKSDAFLIGLIWVIVVFGVVAFAVAAFKASLEILARLKLIKEDRLAYFRSHWIGYMVHALLRTFFVAFIVVMTLSMLQFTIRASTGMAAVTAVVFLVFLLGAVTLLTIACRARTRHGKFEMGPDRIVFHRSALPGGLPILIPAWSSTLKERQIEVRPLFSISFPKIRHINNDASQPTVHLDQAYLKKYGWFSARYRRTRWWFLSYYIIYLVGRAGFLGAGTLSPFAQVYGLLVFEIFAFAILVILNPFEGARNTALAVWMLSISKIASTGLSIAFLPAFKVDRIVATVIGVIIIVIQGLLVIAVLILIVLSGISSWMSLTRNREELGAEYLEDIRVKYFENMQAKAPDTYQPPKPKRSRKGKEKDEEDGTGGGERKEPYFSVISVQRAPKIEDEDEEEGEQHVDDEDDIVHDLEGPTAPTANGLEAGRGATRVSRTNSVSSRRSVSTLPRGIRQHHQHRSSWSSRDFAQQLDTSLSAAAATGTTTTDPDSSIAQRIEGPDNTTTSNQNYSRSNAATPVNMMMADDLVRRVNSRQSLRTLSGAGGGGRPSSPFGIVGTPGLNTPSRETLARYADERRGLTTPQPVIPDLE
ncbi:TRP-domain-containing protein [Echria macrotheca]|uniref:TRP-domain-containing protein n=1 Tax=Echria macrotheca TaxID=438768 RepID=A0AAJ0FCJ5_9PEZI|nr:TRP-domain-containing protein [Echria macrotheca]